MAGSMMGDAASDKKAVISQTERAQHGGVDHKPRTWLDHVRRFWWAYGGVSAIMTVLIVLLIVFVGVPAIAQQKVNQAVLTVDGLAALSTESNSYTLSINSTLYSDSPVSARFDAFDGVMYMDGVGSAADPIMTLTFPEMGSDRVQTVNLTQRVPVNLKPFTDFNAWLVRNQSVQVTVAGRTKVKVAGIVRKFDINFEKTVTIPGLNNFAGINVTQSTVSLVPDANGDNFRGYVTVPNPSVVTLDLGNVTFITYFEGQDVGMTHLDNVMLHPGDNNVTVRSNISALVVVPAVSRQPYCTNGGVLPFVLHGIDVVNHGQSLPYLSGALAQTNLTNDIPLGQDLKKLTGLDVVCL